MRIGTIGQQKKNRINFKDWVKEYYRNGQRYEFKITRIFLPAKFNSFTLICYDEKNGLEISRTLTSDVGKKLLREFKFTIKNPNEFTLFLIVDENGNIDIEKRDISNFGYVFRNNSFALTELKTENEDLDLPF